MDDAARTLVFGQFGTAIRDGSINCRSQQIKVSVAEPIEIKKLAMTVERIIGLLKVVSFGVPSCIRSCSTVAECATSSS